MLTTQWFALELKLILKSETRMRGELNGFFIIKQIEKIKIEKP